EHVRLAAHRSQPRSEIEQVSPAQTTNINAIISRQRSDRRPQNVCAEDHEYSQTSPTDMKRNQTRCGGVGESGPRQSAKTGRRQGGKTGPRQGGTTPADARAARPADEIGRAS